MSQETSLNLYKLINSIFATIKQTTKDFTKYADAVSGRVDKYTNWKSHRHAAWMSTTLPSYPMEIWKINFQLINWKGWKTSSGVSLDTFPTSTGMHLKNEVSQCWSTSPFITTGVQSNVILHNKQYPLQKNNHHYFTCWPEIYDVYELQKSKGSAIRIWRWNVQSTSAKMSLHSQSPNTLAALPWIYVESHPTNLRFTRDN